MAKTLGIEMLDPTVGKPIHDAAIDAHRSGRMFFTCVLVEAQYDAAQLKVSQRATDTRRFAPDELLGAIESTGWRLEHSAHVFVETAVTHQPGFAGLSTGGVAGHVEAHYLFRRV